MKTRVDKILSNSNIFTRSEAKKAISKRRITVNGEIIKASDLKIDENDILAVDGIPVARETYSYIMMNKPEGYVCSTDDPKSPIVFSLLSENHYRKDFFTVGRLDKNTVGLVLITNDGKLAHDLLSPKKHIEKKYYFKLKFPLKGTEADAFTSGILLDDEKITKPAKLYAEKGENDGYLIITEGKFHQVKRMFEAVHNKVVFLQRVEFAGLPLDPALKSGEYRFLTEIEIEKLKS
ncbi:16S rRNA pseudouridine(516) synthase [Eubacteriales bacterium OttesenSCG-928-G02]|nr:16S rRNA pseudouridine(516) synthase [Eubacteriales bacterium OttesenSCG-928-G02]